MKLYDVTISGLPHTLQLTDADAERYGDRAKPHVKAAPAPPNKAAPAPRNK